MQKPSFLFLLIIIGIALLGIYESESGTQTTTAFVRFSALTAYLLLCISLIIGPLVTIWPKEYAQIIEPRRAIGIASFVFILFHIFLVASAYFSWNISKILSMTPLIIGAAAAVIVFILTITSCDYAIKVLGPVGWKKIQQMNYLAFILVTVHFLMKANGLFKNNLPINPAEFGLITLGLITVVLQIAGFVARRNKPKK
ncbi:MAG: hypothetical protein ABID61_06165 [Candidatus Micrarchaeota archaeon]